MLKWISMVFQIILGGLLGFLFFRSIFFNKIQFIDSIFNKINAGIIYFSFNILVLIFFFFIIKLRVFALAYFIVTLIIYITFWLIMTST